MAAVAWRRRRRWGPSLAAVGLALTAAACSSASAPEVPAGPGGTPDPTLVAGRQTYVQRCASCHGASGGGSRGPKLSEGEVLAAYPDIEDQIDVVAQGRGGMPAFGDTLDPGEIDAVVRYTREVLSGG